MLDLKFPGILSLIELFVSPSLSALLQSWSGLSGDTGVTVD